MAGLKSIRILQYFIKTITSAVVMGLLAITIIQSGIIDFLLEPIWMRPVMMFALAVIPILFAVESDESNDFDFYFRSSISIDKPSKDSLFLIKLS